MKAGYKSRKRAAAIALIATGIFALTISVFLGSSGISAAETISALFGAGQAASSAIVLNIRIPRALFAFAAGGALSVCGACLQGVFKNPMADSYTLGVSSGASLGAAAAIAAGLSAAGGAARFITPMAFAGGLLAVFIVYSFSRFSGRVSSFSLILAGVAVSALMSALTYFIMIMNRDKMEAIVMWTMGSLSAVTWEKLAIAAPVTLVCSAVSMFFSRDLNIMLQGDEEARHLGVDTSRVRAALLAATTLSAAAVVSYSGVIGFVGLIVPHVLRIITGPDHRSLIPLSYLGGAVFLLLCDTAARVVLPSQELPVGVVTAVIGAPYFLYLLRRGRKEGRL